MRWLCLILSLVSLPTIIYAVKCMDCSGDEDCMQEFCQGDYCVHSQYAPRWGHKEWGNPKVVKGCMSGDLLRKGVKDHCEVADDNNQEVFTCFCNGRQNCNSGRALKNMDEELVPLVSCVCKGEHCKSKSCVGEMCTFVTNHETGATEQGCVNASVPLIERRTIGACMMPPITGAMHHTVSKTVDELMNTESCICGSDWCNTDKPDTSKVKETQTCPTMVYAKTTGAPAAQTEQMTCQGEFCFQAKIRSKLGVLENYMTKGCMTFTGNDELAEELKPVGCAEFKNTDLLVKACFNTTDKRAIGRAEARQQIGNPKPSKSRKPEPKMEIDYTNDNEEDEEEEEEPVEEKKPQRKQKEQTRPKFQRKPAEKEEEVEEEQAEAEEEQEEEEEANTEVTEAPVESTTGNFIFEKPTQASIPDESNATMITVFVIIILCILVSGAFWKLELHKKLTRSSYDTVAGG